MSTDLDYDDVYGEKKLEALIAKERRSQWPLVKQAYRISPRKSRFAKRKARFATMQEYKQRKRDLGKLYLFGENPDSIAYNYHKTNLRKLYGLE